MRVTSSTLSRTSRPTSSSRMVTGWPPSCSDGHLHGVARAGRRLLEVERHPPSRRARVAGRRGSARSSTSSRSARDRSSMSSRCLMARPPMQRPRRAARRPGWTRPRRSRSSLTSSDGASRTVVGRHRVDDQPVGQRRRRPRPWRRARAPARRRAADRCPGRRSPRGGPRARSVSRSPARRARPGASSRSMIRRTARARPPTRAAGRRTWCRGRPADITAATSRRAQQAPIGTPLPSALAIVTTSGTTSWCSKPNHRPGAAETGLHLVDHEQHAPLVAQPPHALEVLGAGRVDAALALHRLEQHAATLGVDRGVQGVEVVPGHVAEAFGQGLEGLVLGRAGRWRAAWPACARGTSRRR